MRSILTYPIDAATYYIDPDYWSSLPISGNPVDGWSKRMYDMHNGIQYGGGTPLIGYAGHSEILSYSKDGYFSDSEIVSDNLQMYDIWKKPIVSCETELAVNNISQFSYHGLTMLDNDYKRTGMAQISNMLLTRDPNDEPSVGSGSATPWQMPHNTRFNVDWELTNTGSSSLNTDFYISYDNNTGTGVQRLRTGPAPTGSTINNNWEDWYRFGINDLGGQYVTLFGGFLGGYASETWYPPAMECLTGATRNEGYQNKILTLTGGTQTIKVAVMDDWWWGRNPNDNNPNDAVNFGDVKIGWGNDGFSTLPASNNPEAKMDMTIHGYADSNGQNQGTVYVETPGTDPYGLRTLYTDSAKTTVFTNSSLTQAGYAVGGANQPTTTFSGKIFSNTNGASDSTQSVIIHLGYTDVPSGYFPVPPAGNVSQTLINNILAYACNFSNNNFVNYDTGTVTWDHKMGEMMFPAYVSLPHYLEWDRDVNNPTDHLYSGFDYEKPRMCRLVRTTHDDAGSNPNNPSYWYSWKLSVGGVPKMTYDPGGQRHYITTYTNTFTIKSGNSETDGYVELPQVAGGVTWTHQNNTVNELSTQTNKTVTISDNEPAKYRLKPYIVPGDRSIYCGNEKYIKRTGESTYENAAFFNEEFWDGLGATSISTDPNVKFPYMVPSQNAGGYITNVSFGINTDNSEGRNSAGLFTTNAPKLFEIAKEPDTYTPPAPTPIEIADSFNTMDQWSTTGYSNDPDVKLWPDHVPPTSANITYNNPTIANMSQSGVKYTRGSAHTKWRLEVEYPPMTPEDFRQYAAIAQAAHGQSIPFFFKLIGKDNTSKILWKQFHNTASTNTPKYAANYSPGTSVVTLEGFQSNEANVFGKGEVVIGNDNENGFLHTVLSPQSANVFGEVKIRTSLPQRSNIYQWQTLYKDPYWAVVTLDSDNFEYSTDANGYYYLNIAFDLDTWK